MVCNQPPRSTQPSTPPGQVVRRGAFTCVGCHMAGDLEVCTRTVIALIFKLLTLSDKVKSLKIKRYSGETPHYELTLSEKRIPRDRAISDARQISLSSIFSAGASNRKTNLVGIATSVRSPMVAAVSSRHSVISRS